MSDAQDTSPEHETSRTGLPGLIFPTEPRHLPGQRAIKIVLRGFHVLCAGVLTGAYLFEVESDLRVTWLLATLVTGLLILAVDLFESGAFLLQVRGAVLLAKILLLAFLPHLGDLQALVLCGVVVVSVISSHAPSKVRYFALVGRGRIKGASTKG